MELVAAVACLYVRVCVCLTSCLLTPLLDVVVYCVRYLYMLKVKLFTTVVFLRKFFFDESNFWVGQ